MIGVDFGGTYIKVAAVQGAEIVQQVSVPTPRDATPLDVLDTLAGAVRQIDRAPDEVGVAIPGEVDRTGRCWRLPNVPGFEGIEIAREISRRLGGARIVVENDATAAALGELVHGHGRRYASFLLVMLGTGVGGGLVMNGSLVRGAHGFAAEIGHVPIDNTPEAWPCGCGHVGCVEAYAGTEGILRTYRELGGAATAPVEIAAAAVGGETAAVETFSRVGRALGRMLTAVQNVLDLDAVVFSGGISASFRLFEPALRAALVARAHAPPLGAVPLITSELDARAGMVGAAHLVRLATLPLGAEAEAPGDLGRP
jgi:glucokinase